MLRLTVAEAAHYLGIKTKARGKRTDGAAKKRAQASALAGKAEAILLGLPAYVTEHRFHPTRRWRFDYAWPELKIAMELHGGVHSGGRHTRGKGFVADREKMNTAIELGWRVIEVTPEHIKNGTARRWLEQLITTGAKGDDGNGHGHV